MKKIKTLLFSFVPFILSIGLQFFAVFALLFIAIVQKGPSANVDEILNLTQDMDFNTTASILFSAISIIIFSFWYFKRCGGKFKLDIKTDFHPYEILGILLLVPGAQFMSAIVTSLISLAFPSWLEDYMQLLENAGLSGEVSLLMMIYSVCLAPIGEELVFRGVTYRIARRAFPFWFANILQAALFGLFHMNPMQGCYTFILGLFMGYICEKGGTLYHAIFFHILFNLWGTTASQWLVVDNVAIQGLIIIFGTYFGLKGGFHFLRKANKGAVSS